MGVVKERAGAAPDPARQLSCGATAFPGGPGEGRGSVLKRFGTTP